MIDEITILKPTFSFTKCKENWEEYEFKYSKASYKEVLDSIEKSTVSITGEEIEEMAILPGEKNNPVKDQAFYEGFMKCWEYIYSKVNHK